MKVGSIVLLIAVLGFFIARKYMMQYLKQYHYAVII